MGKTYKTCILFIIIGAVLGGILGELMRDISLFSGVVPVVSQSFPIFHIAPTTINLYVVEFMFSLSFAPNLMSLIGVVVALIYFRRY